VRILTLTHYQLPHWGGIEMTAAALHARYRAMGHESRWLSSDLPPAPPAEGQIRVPASDLPFRLSGVKYPLWGPSAARAVSRAIEWCDVVNPHDCLYLGTLFAVRAARRLGKPLILTQHAGPWPFYESWLLRQVQLGAYQTLGLAVHRRVEQAVFISRAVQAWFSARVRYPQPTRFIANGVDTARFAYADAVARAAARARLQLSRDRRIILYVGRFLAMKGLPVIEQVARRMPAAQFILVGAGPIDPRTWALPNVTVVPVVEQAALRDYYAAGDVLVLPSTGEGFPLVVAEAMACGTPAIVSPETYAAWDRDRERFLIAAPTPTADAVQALLCDDTPLLQPAGRAAISAYAHAHWSWDAAARAYVELFGETLAAQ